MLFAPEAQLTPDLSYGMTIDAAFAMSIDAGGMEVVARVSPSFWWPPCPGVNANANSQL